MITVVIPTVGRDSLRTLIRSLQPQLDDAITAVLVVDDRRDQGRALGLPEDPRIRVIPGPGRGPAAARNRGWRRAKTRWIAFLDDDVVVPDDWARGLLRDLIGLADDVAGSQGRLRVPLPLDRRPTDWERNTAGLATAAWATADMAYRRSALADVGGFDERFPRAFREDADLALRLLDHGWRLVRGDRETSHPVRQAPSWISVRVQAGNADDALMRRLHGRQWHRRARAPRGRIRRHAAVTAAGLGGIVATALGRRRAGAGLAVLWLGGTAEFAAARMLPGPRDRTEISRLAWTSAVIPPVAVAYALLGSWRHRTARPWPVGPRAVLFDRDGTLVHDVPYNGDPDRIQPVPHAREAVDRLRRAGVRVGVVTNQSGIARRLFDADQLRAVNHRVDELLGPFDTWQVCPHAPEDGCRCRKPQPGLIARAAAALGVAVGECVVIGDIGSDVAAAEAAGARAILVPTAVTRREEVDTAPQVAPDLTAAVDLVLGGVA